MKRLLAATLMVLALPTFAEVISLSPNLNQKSEVSVRNLSTKNFSLQEIEFRLSKLTAEKHHSHSQYSVLTENGISFSQTVGEAQLPFKSVLVSGTPSEVEITVEPGTPVEVSLISAPAQPEDCRCDDGRKKQWVPLKSSRKGLYRVDYLGKYRGQDMSRVTIMAAETDLSRGLTRFYPELKAQIRSEQILGESFEPAAAYDYLIVSPSALIASLNEFVQYKTQTGLRVKVVALEDIGANVAKLTEFFKAQYQENKYKYALIVGTDDLVPNHKVRTSGSSYTPSDYPFFLMDSQDMIPDVHYGRIIATTPEQVARQAQKWITYQERIAEVSSYLRMIGIASNEGYNPSDNDYVLGMEKDLNAAYGTVATHFYQDDATSKPSFINEAFNQGTAFLVYLGHGSGTSWASTGTYYNTTHVKQMNNPGVLQPFIVDVACQNGILKNGYLGETFLNATNAQGEGIGASMYYGGSVNISWHPPAIMAKGLVKKVISDSLEEVGEALLAGHLYLLENYTDLESVRDNFEWYHLFGDPSSPLYLK